MRLVHELVPSWPGLAWLAECGDAEVVIRHGSRVEVTDEWFCEAAWAGPYGEGGFDQTDIVAGSGGRLRNNEVIFVSSGSTVDRLQRVQLGDRVLVSNSLVCLLAGADAAPDPTYSHYYRDFRTIIDGLSRYKRWLATDRGPVELVYFDNLVWDGRNLERRAKPLGDRELPKFGAYRAFLAGSMTALAGNLKDGNRRHPYATLGTLSSGYDSSTVTVLAREIGNDEVLSFDRARDGSDDRGEAAAAVLGLRTRIVDREAWRRKVLPEIPFLAANSYGEEMHFRGAEPYLAGRVLFTGFHGDKVWAKDTKDLSHDIVRGDPTGLALTEYRLAAGFLHCAVPFWGVRQIRQIHTISCAAEMGPWDIPGDYSRPICRRIVEEAGVPREAFGMRKCAASVVLRIRTEGFLTPDALADYRRWLRLHGTLWLRQGRVPLILAGPLEEITAAAHARVLDCMPTGLRNRMRKAGVRGLIPYNPSYLFNHLFPWAIAHQKTRYQCP